jgi:hypothetical protein
MAGLRLFLLGPPRLECDGVPLKFSTRKNIALINVDLSILTWVDDHYTMPSLGLWIRC